MEEEWRRNGGGAEEEEKGEWRRECMEENRGQVRGTEPALYNPT